MTIVDHLYGVHLQWANGMVVACREQLGADHPVRRFLTPYYFGTIQVRQRRGRRAQTEEGRQSHRADRE